MKNTKYIFLILLPFLVSGCGGPIHAASTSTPPTFFPQQSLTCTGDILSAGGQQCTQSDGVHFYRGDQFALTIRPDGHGTFQIISEDGIGNFTGLHQITFQFPVPVQLLEIHGTATINSWCNSNGVLSTWDSSDTLGNVSHIVGGKTYAFNSGETTSFVIPQTVFPSPLPVSSLTHTIYTDLCGTSTVHWVLYGSF